MSARGPSTRSVWRKSSRLRAEPRVAICRIPASEEQSGLPKWDRDRRQLRFDGQVVKEFKLPSPNQEAVLMALEEDGWPARSTTRLARRRISTRDAGCTIRSKP